MLSVTYKMESSVSRIYIIHTEATKNTSRRLEEDLQPLSKFSGLLPDIASAYSVGSADDVKNVFGAIKKDCIDNNVKPLLHVDFHGSEQHGLVVKPGHYLSWEWFASRCREVNIACQNKFGVVMACCYGLNAIRGVRIGELVPFQYLIGSQETIYEGADIDDSFSLFYKKLFETRSFEVALVGLPNKFQPFYAEKMLFIVLAKYLKAGTYGKGFQERKERLITELVEAGQYPTPQNLKLLRASITERLKFDKDGVQEVIDKYSASFLGQPSQIKIDDLMTILDR
ncbi:hypothetical protein [Collimonas sp.]|uniref:hypothetical protein n=1 Tax=Collimonas sp. TaxID=1963772 RepID=UPI002CAD34E4|nr:hypothetical protein [Collimonas sp.]HWW05612.1 hypothetical protein [Collimonas sp.]